MTAVCDMRPPMELKLSGPYAFTPASGHPLFSQALDAYEHGIYLWAVHLENAFRVNYVGKTDASFLSRLNTEKRRSLSGLDGYFDETLFCHGIRQAIGSPTVGAAEQLRRTLDCCLVFLGPLNASASELLTVEAVLIRRIQSCSPNAAAFLARQRVPTNRRLAEPLRVVPPAGIVIEGLEEPFCV